MTITVEAKTPVPPATAWHVFTTPEHVKAWNAASDDWHTPEASNDLREGGTFTYRMAARDGSTAFDFTGTYTAVDAPRHLAYSLEDGRTVTVDFIEDGDATLVRETFDADSEATADQERAGWQAILDRFARHAAEVGVAGDAG